MYLRRQEVETRRKRIWMKADPNIAERQQQALLVTCPYCWAGIGMKCWTTRSKIGIAGAGVEKRYVHSQRIKASWQIRTSQINLHLTERNRINR